MDEAPAARTVLIVEDDPFIAELLRWIVISQPGYCVVVAATGAGAWAVVTSQVVDLVLLDLRLPDGDGLGVLDQIRADPQTAALPVLLLTGRADDPRLRDRAVPVLVKPFEPQAVLGFVRALCPPAGPAGAP
ncbi:MAG TPA: response regulator [Chloroflexia bacterium]|nr:response regulator [Chloroflexia bacterium]